MNIIKPIIMRLTMICAILAASLSISARAEDIVKIDKEETTNIESQDNKVIRMKQISDDCYVNLDYYENNRSYERLVDRQNHLNGWSKFCTIYGIICAAVGGFDLGGGIVNGDGYAITIGALSVAEGLAAGFIGDALKKKRNKAREEINQINSVGFPTAEYQVGKVNIAPSVNLLSDNKSHQNAVGFGLRFEF